MFFSNDRVIKAVMSSAWVYGFCCRTFITLVICGIIEFLFVVSLLKVGKLLLGVSLVIPLQF